jgi:hypothetical protein
LRGSDWSEFKRINEFTAACRRYWPEAKITLWPDSAFIGAETLSDPEPAPQQHERDLNMTMLTESDLDGVYGSAMLSATGLGDRRLKVRIKDVRKETLQGRGPGELPRARLVLDLDGTNQRMVLNATNFEVLRSKIGRDPQKWVGTTIGISAEDTSFGGRATKGLCLRVLDGAQKVEESKSLDETI